MRLVLSDLDGTFVAPDKSVPRENMAALDLLAGRGVAFVPCTGRPVHGIPMEVLRHPATRFAVGSDGAIVCQVGEDGSLSALRTCAMPPAAVRAVLAAARERGLFVDVLCGGRVYASPADIARLPELIGQPVEARLMQGLRTPTDLPLEALVERLGEPVLRMVACGDDAGLAEVAVLAGRAGGVSATSALPHEMELTAVGATKGEALRWLCERLGVPAAETVAFGDTANDVSMLEAAGVGVAVANASEAACAAADEVTASNDEAGVARWLRAHLGPA